MKRLIEYDPDTKISTFVDYDHPTKVSTVTESQDCTDIIESNKRLIADNHNTTKQGIKNSWMLLGTVPNVFIQECALETGLDPYSREGIDYIVKKIHQRDYKLLKVANGNFV